MYRQLAMEDTSQGGSLTQSMLPAFIECFGIIGIGYFFGQVKLIEETGAKGLCIFLQYISLPALIFVSLATISFSSIEWKFVAAVLVAKTSVFVTVAAMTMLLTKPAHLGKSGIYAIVTTQSNDLALGYPLITSLYRGWHSSYTSILYIIVPIQMLILNPVGFFMLEANKNINSARASTERTFITLLKGICMNPIIIMTVFGIAWNFAFSHTIPLAINQLLDALSSTFSTVALFVLGFTMSKEIQEIKGYFSLIPALLVMTKILVLPLLLQRITSYFLSGSPEVQDLSSLGFLYGTFPSAPTVFIFAKQYDVSVDVITSTTVYSTLFSAPLMLTSAAMISLTQNGFENIGYYLTETISCVGALNLVCCLCFIFTFITKKRWRDVCCVAVAYLVIAQTITSVGAVTQFIGSEAPIEVFYVYYILSSVGLFSTYLFTVFLSVLIFFLQWRSLCFVLRYRTKINVFGFLLPMLISVVISVSVIWLGKHSSHPNFQLGRAQVVASLLIFSTTFLATSAFLVFQHRHVKISDQHSNEECATESRVCSVQPTVNDSESVSESETLLKNGTQCSECCCQYAQNNAVNICLNTDIEDAACEIRYGTMIQNSNVYSQFCKFPHSCNACQREQCVRDVHNYRRELSNNETDLNSGDQYVRYIIVTLSLCFSMLVSITVCIAYLVTEASTGILVELQFLDVILQNSQGVICFLLFGIDLYVPAVIVRGWQHIKSFLNAERSS